MGSSFAIEPWTLGDLGGSGFASKIYDDLDTDVSVSRRPEHLGRSSAPTQEQVRSNLWIQIHHQENPHQGLHYQVLPKWEAADLTRRFQEKQKMKTHRWVHLKFPIPSKFLDCVLWNFSFFFFTCQNRLTLSRLYLVSQKEIVHREERQ